MALIKRFLSGYTENFLVAIALWPLASLALTLPILAYLYHRDGRLRFISFASTYLAVLYLLGLCCFTLYPLPSGSSGPGITYGVPWQLDPLACIDDFRREGVSTLPQIVFNVVLFLPLGFIAGRLLRLGCARAVCLGFAVSFAIEAAQGTGLFGVYPFAYRTADVNDLMYNTAGAALGWAAASALARVLPPGALADEDQITHRAGFVRRCVAFWLDMLLWGLVVLVISAGLSLVAPLGSAERNFIASTGLLVIGSGAFIWIEGVVPWNHEGSTPGGAFVRMSCETHQRSCARRAVFYLARGATLGGFCLMPTALGPILVLFFLVARRMPYDFI